MHLDEDECSSFQDRCLLPLYSMATEWAYVRSVMRVQAIVSLCTNCMAEYQSFHTKECMSPCLLWLHIHRMQQIMLSCCLRRGLQLEMVSVRLWCLPIWSMSHCVTHSQQSIMRQSAVVMDELSGQIIELNHTMRIGVLFARGLFMNYEKETVLKMVSCRANGLSSHLPSAPTTSYRLRKWYLPHYLSLLFFYFFFRKHTH